MATSSLSPATAKTHSPSPAATTAYSPAATMASSDATPATAFSPPAALPSSDTGLPNKHITSRLRTQEALTDICKKHSVPRGFTPLLAGDRLACARPPARSVCVHAGALEAGLRLPLHPLFAAALRQFGIAPGQLAPAAWRLMAGFVALSRSAGVEPSLAVFRRFFALEPRALRGGFCYTLSGRGDAGGQLFRETATAACEVDGWEEEFFFVRASTAWPCPVRWREASSSAAHTPALTRGQKEWAVSLMRARGSAPIDLDAYLREKIVISPQGNDASPVDVTMGTVKSEPYYCDEDELPCPLGTGKKRKMVCDDGSPPGSSSGSKGGDTAHREAAKQLLALERFQSKPGDHVVSSSSKMALLETAKHVAFTLDYAFDLEDKLCKVNAELAAAGADALRAELDHTKAENSKMKVALQAMNGLGAELHRLKLNVERRRDAEAELAKVNGELAEAKAAAASAKAEREHAVAALRVELAKVKDELVQTKAEREHAVAALRVELGDAKADLAKTKAGGKQLLAVVDALREELGNVKAELGRTRATAAKANLERARAAAEADALRAELGGAKAAMEAAKSAAAAREFLGSKKYAEELADWEMEGYERGLTDMKLAALESCPELDPARPVVPIHKGLLAPGRANAVQPPDAAHS